MQNTRLPQFYNKVTWNKLTGKELYDSLETIDIGSKMGSTGYIDCLQPSDLYNVSDSALDKENETKSKMVKGVDVYGRKFVSLKCKFKYFEANRYYSNTEWNDCVFTIFQRYINNDDLWVIGGYIQLSGGSSDMNSYDRWAKLNELLNKGYLNDGDKEFKF